MAEDNAPMTDAVKRKEPEPEKAEGSPAADKPAESKQESPAKRPKTTPAAAAAASRPESAVVRKQLEYYLSDENLKYDKFFHEKISGEKDGWLEMSVVLTCNKMKAMRATKEDVVEALKDSKIEVKEDASAVRRPGNLPLPTLEAKPLHMQHQKKSSIHAHDGGCVIAVSNVPEEQSWKQVKEKIVELIHAKFPKVQAWFCSEVSEKGQCIIATSPFSGDIEFFQEVNLEVGGAKLKVEVCYADLLQQALKQIPKHIRDKRERESRKRQKERNRPIVVGSQKFTNVAALRGRVKEILNSRPDGELLKPEGSDFKLIKALLAYHPKGEEKSRGMTGIKVAPHTGTAQKSGKGGDSRCFYMTKEGGIEEDFSAKKCLDAIELNPPYVQAEPKASPKAKAEPKADGDSPSAASTAAATKPEAPAAAAEGAAPAKEAPAAAAEAAAPAKEAAPASEAEAATPAKEVEPAKEAQPAKEEDEKKPA